MLRALRPFNTSNVLHEMDREDWLLIVHRRIRDIPKDKGLSKDAIFVPMIDWERVAWHRLDEIGECEVAEQEGRWSLQWKRLTRRSRE